MLYFQDVPDKEELTRQCELLRNAPMRKIVDFMSETFVKRYHLSNEMTVAEELQVFHTLKAPQLVSRPYSIYRMCLK